MGTIKEQERHVIITGFGVQGIILAGDILGRAATLYDHKFATMTQSYGPEARGSACSAQVIISEQEILFPYVREPQILICLSQEGYSKNIANLRPGGVLVWDADLVRTKNLDPSLTTYNIPATRIAEELGNRMMANIVMLGFFAAVHHVVSVQAMRKAVLSSVPEPTKEVNAQAFERGLKYGEAILKSKVKQGRARIN